MKRLIKTFLISGLFIITVYPVFSLPGGNESVDTLNLEEKVEKENDTITYELVIFDPGFNSWYMRESRPASFYSQAYLERWNKILTDQWNQLIHSARRRDCIPGVYLDYDTDIDYGMQFNHELFYYFKYMHRRCRLFTSTPGRW